MAELASKEYTDAAYAYGHPVVIEERFLDGDTDFKTQLERIKKTHLMQYSSGEMPKNQH